MEKIITIDNFHYFAYCNNKLCKKPIRGIIVMFCGLGVDPMEDTSVIEDLGYADQGIIYLVPYQNTWAWMNKQTVDFTDELIDVLFREYDLPENLPIVSTGLSMGGLSALVYTAYAKRTPVACVANCPVCDLPYHYTERPDLPRTLYSAFGTYAGTLDDAMRSASPIHIVDKLPVSTSYYVFHCDEDPAVNKQKHSDRFVEKMLAEHSVFYFPVPSKGHCQLTEQMQTLYNDCILKSILEK